MSSCCGGQALSVGAIRIFDYGSLEHVVPLELGLGVLSRFGIPIPEFRHKNGVSVASFYEKNVFLEKRFDILR